MAVFVPFSVRLSQASEPEQTALCLRQGMTGLNGAPRGCDRLLCSSQTETAEPLQFSTTTRTPTPQQTSIVSKLRPTRTRSGWELGSSTQPSLRHRFRILRRLLLSRRIASTRLPFAISGTGSNPPSQWHCNGEPVLKSGAWRQRTVELANTTLAILNSAASHEPHVQKTRTNTPGWLQRSCPEAVLP